MKLDIQKGGAENMKKMVEYIKQHDVKAKIENGQLFVLDEWTDMYGNEGSEWLILEPNYTIIRNFLGY